MSRTPPTRPGTARPDLVRPRAPQPLVPQWRIVRPGAPSLRATSARHRLFVKLGARLAKAVGRDHVVAGGPVSANDRSLDRQGRLTEEIPVGPTVKFVLSPQCKTPACARAPFWSKGRTRSRVPQYHSDSGASDLRATLTVPAPGFRWLSPTPWRPTTVATGSREVTRAVFASP
jgi:hypothetical protein